MPFVAMLAAACAITPAHGRTIYADSVNIGHGTARTWIRYEGATRHIDAVGITFSASTLEDLPKAADLKGPMPMEMWILDLPKPIQGLPYDHVEIDWNPIGHPPAHVYDKPHFDFHFYTIPKKIQNSITAEGADMGRCMKKPNPKYVPPGYILPPGTVIPQMGVHWVNPATSPEIRGGTFTSTFIYGTYNGRTAFWEPMVTIKYLLTKPHFYLKIAQPKAYDQTGYFPTAYQVSYDAKSQQYSVELDGLKFHHRA